MTGANSLNWNQLVQDSATALEVIADGDYTAYISKSTFTETKADPAVGKTAKPMFKVQWRIVGGPYNNRIVFDQWVVTADNPNAMFIFFSKMKAIGLGAEFFAQNPSNDQIAKAMEGKYASLTVGHRTWSGVERNEVRSITPTTDPTLATQTSAAIPTPTPVPTAPIPAPTPPPPPPPTPTPLAETPLAPPAPDYPAPPQLPI